MLIKIGKMDSTPLPSTSTTPARRKSISRREVPSTTASTTQPSTRTRVPPLPTTSTFSSSSTPGISNSSSSLLRPRHSLYGTEDRVILDLGSRIWKIGFSGESNIRTQVNILSLIGKELTELKLKGKEREGSNNLGLWGLEKGEIEEVEWELRELRLKKGLREVWFK